MPANMFQYLKLAFSLHVFTSGIITFYFRARAVFVYHEKWYWTETFLVLGIVFLAWGMKWIRDSLSEIND